MRKYPLVLLFALAIASMQVSLAEVFTLSPTGMTDACNEEFENVANSLQPGDELILEDGIYAQGCARRIDINGTAAQPILIRAAAGAMPVITRPNATSVSHNNIELSGSYYTVRGLHFQYGSSGVRIRVSNNITFEDNKISDTLNNALTMNSGATDSHIVRGNEIYNTGLASGSTEGEGMYLGDHNGGFSANNHLIENNHIHDLRGTSGGGNDGIEIKFRSGGNIVRNNLIHDTNIGLDFPCIFVYGHGDAPNIVENNVVYNCGEAILVTADAIIRNNVILDSSINGIYLNQQNPAPFIQNVTIVNNTVYGSHPTCARFNVGTAPDIHIANNVFDCADSTAVRGSGLDNAQMANNYVRGTLSNASIDNERFYSLANSAQPYANPAARNFRLVENAVLIDAGDSSAQGLSLEDHDGNARVSGNAVDVGAFEFNSGSSNAPIVSLLGPDNVDEGADITLIWASTGAESCEANGDWSGAKATSGSESVGPLTANASFVLVCTGTGGMGSATLNVTVNPIPEPVVEFSGPTSVNAGESATLVWTSSNTQSCVASGDWSGSKAINGSETVGPLSTTATFVLSCSGAGGEASQMITVVVTDAMLPRIEFAGPSSVQSGQLAMLTWSVSNATSCDASGDWSGAKGLSGTQSVGPVEQDSTYVLTCAGTGGSSTASVTVTVTDLPPAMPTVELIGPSSINQGDSVTLMWNSTNAQSCIASGAWSGNKDLSGNETVGPLSSDSSFVLTCSGAGGQSIASVNVMVVAAPVPTVQLSGPASVDSGDTVLVSWTSTNATACTASGAWSGAKAITGNETLAAITSTSSYTLSCSGLGGMAESTLNVAVSDISQTPVDNSSGGGAFHPLALLLLLPMASHRRRRRHLL